MIGDDQSNTYFNAGNAKTSPPSIGASAFACFNVQQNAAIKVTASVGSSSFLGLCIAEFSGTYGTNSGAGIDGVGTSFGNSSAPTSGNLATTQDNLLYLGVVTANADGFVVTEESGWTRLCSLTGRMSVGSPISVEYRTAIAGTYAAMWTSGATVLWTAGLFTFLPSASVPLSPQP
ncbi:MAG: hypothetical protein ACREQ5_03270, partial [Candidatus Dormibacteria bacterium]